MKVDLFIRVNCRALLYASDVLIDFITAVNKLGKLDVVEHDGEYFIFDLTSWHSLSYHFHSDTLLRTLHKLCPLAFLIERAGGMAVDGVKAVSPRTLILKMELLYAFRHSGRECVRTIVQMCLRVVSVE